MLRENQPWCSRVRKFVTVNSVLRARKYHTPRITSPTPTRLKRIDSVKPIGWLRNIDGLATYSVSSFSGTAGATLVGGAGNPWQRSRAARKQGTIKGPAGRYSSTFSSGCQLGKQPPNGNSFFEAGPFSSGKRERPFLGETGRSRFPLLFRSYPNPKSALASQPLSPRAAAWAYLVVLSTTQRLSLNRFFDGELQCDRSNQTGFQQRRFLGLVSKHRKRFCRGFGAWLFAR